MFYAQVYLLSDTQTKQSMSKSNQFEGAFYTLGSFGSKE